MIELEAAFGITARLREVRDTMRGLQGESYQSRCEPWQRVIRAEMQKSGCSALLAASRIIKRDFEYEGIVQAMLVSAAVEVIEADGE